MRLMLAATLALTLSPSTVLAQEGHAQPRKVAVFLYPGVELLDFAGPAEVFAAARAEGQPLFEVYTVAEAAGALVSQGFLEVVPDYTFDDCPKPDLVVLPGGGVPLGRPGVVEWVREVAAESEVTLSVCNGALLLARAGLLDGLEATTHHSALEHLMLIAPETRVHDDRRFVDNGRIVTAAGVSAGIDGALHVVARLAGEEVARATARYMEYRWEPEKAHAYQGRVVAAGERSGAFRVARAARDGGVAAALAVWKELEERPPETELNRVGYALLGTERGKEAALAVFELNARAFPASPNVWDSLGDALEANGNVERAIECSEKCLALLPTAEGLDRDWAQRVRASAEAKLSRLRSTGDTPE